MLYLIECDAYYKIGYTKNLENRLREYDTLNPSYKLLDFKEGSYEDETTLHKLCKKFLFKGEWFHKNDQILTTWNSYISTNSKGAYDHIHFYPEFYQLFYRFKDSLSKDLLLYIINHSTNNIMRLRSEDLLIMCKSFNTSKDYVFTCLKLFSDNEVLFHNQEVLMLNPYLVWKGSLKFRNNCLTYWDDNTEFLKHLDELLTFGCENCSSKRLEDSFVVPYLEDREYTYQELKDIFSIMFKNKGIEWNDRTTIKHYFPRFKKYLKKVNGKPIQFYKFDLQCYI